MNVHRATPPLPCSACGEPAELQWSLPEEPGAWRCTGCHELALSPTKRAGFRRSEDYRREVEGRPDPDEHPDDKRVRETGVPKGGRKGEDWSKVRRGVARR